MTMSWWKAGGIVLAAIFAAPLHAQTESQLRHYFEGKDVVVKLDMPADKSGVDVHPRLSPAVNYSKVAKRIRAYGIGVKIWERVTVTRVKVKSKLIEFQLGGGGYGTFDDILSEPTVPNTYVPPSKREKRLRKELRATDDRARRKELKEELYELEELQRRQEAVLQTAAPQAEIMREQHIREGRRSSGSRFNLRYRSGAPPETLTPQGVMAALREYVVFPADEFPDASTDQESVRGVVATLEGFPYLVRSDDMGDYTEGLDDVSAIITSDGSFGVLSLGMRTLNFDLNAPTSGDNLGTITSDFNLGVTVPGGLLGMNTGEENSVIATKVRFNFAGTELKYSLTYEPVPYDSNCDCPTVNEHADVLVTRVDDNTWVVEAIPGNYPRVVIYPGDNTWVVEAIPGNFDIAKLESSPNWGRSRPTDEGNYHAPFKLTLRKQ